MRAFICVMAAGVLLGGCKISYDGECDEDGRSGAGRPERPNLPGNAGGTSATGGGSGAGAEDPSGSGGSGSSGAGAGASGGGAGASGNDEPVPCVEEADCPRGFNCDYELNECTPADAETCGELASEVSCDNRNDCVTVYAGTNCSCGPECACIGGEPGCVCESFAFFRCEPVVE